MNRLFQFSPEKLDRSEKYGSIFSSSPVAKLVRSPVVCDLLQYFYSLQNVALQRHQGVWLLAASHPCWLRSGHHDVLRLAVWDELRGPAAHQQQRGKEVSQSKAFHDSAGASPVYKLVISLILFGFMFVLSFVGDSKRFEHLFLLTRWRVCLDEAQMIENTTNKTAEMALRLKAINRWCVTGTPIGKSLNDIQGLLLFLQVPFVKRYQPFWMYTL